MCVYICIYTHTKKTMYALSFMHYKQITYVSTVWNAPDPAIHAYSSWRRAKSCWCSGWVLIVSVGSKQSKSERKNMSFDVSDRNRTNQFQKTHLELNTWTSSYQCFGQMMSLVQNIFFGPIWFFELVSFQRWWSTTSSWKKWLDSKPCPVYIYIDKVSYDCKYSVIVLCIHVMYCRWTTKVGSGRLLLSNG